jgi:hypothetical protein
LKDGKTKCPFLMKIYKMKSQVIAVELIIICNSGTRDWHASAGKHSAEITVHIG